MYELKHGEYVKGGKLYGWTGEKCGNCGGYGEIEDARACSSCAGTGEQHALMPVQPASLPPDTE